MLVQLNSGSTPVTPTTPTSPTTPTTPSAIYNRDDYLKGWADVDGDCQDSRQEVLIQESIVPVVLSTDGCQVTMGLWHDPYTALTFTNPSDLDIDHLVPLKEAHDSGAWLWSLDAKRSYANNITNPLVLIAVDDNTNQSKGDRDPAGWLPPNVSYRCDYAKSWIAVKQTYGLTMDAAEESAINKILNLSQHIVAARSRSGVTLTNLGNMPSQSAFSVAMTSSSICGNLIKVSQSTPITIMGSVTPDPQHVGQVVDIIVVAVLGNVIVMKTPDGNFLPWNLELKTLKPAVRGVSLNAPMEFEIIAGALGLRGVLQLFIGYLTASGQLVYSPDPASFEFVDE
jgi:hypothetical protein